MNAESLDELVKRLQALCLERSLLVATAESCTGGLIAKLITDVPGSSGYFRGGVVAYANAIKEGMLGVPGEELAAHGSVSAQVAMAMARGIVARTRATLGVAVTGVSGPGGGTPSKPVGLTYVAVADPRGVAVKRFVWSGDRKANREATARAAIELLLECAAALEPGVEPRSSKPGPEPASTPGPT